MEALMVPELASLVNVPIFVGLAKEPAAFDTWAVYVLPLNVPVRVKWTETAAPLDAVTQNGEPVIVPVVIVGDKVVNVPCAL